jgi:L-malate glycosyltransferase
MAWIPKGRGYVGKLCFMCPSCEPTTGAKPLRVLHVVSGDLWAGAEVQVYQLLRAARCYPGVVIRAVILNPGMLAKQLAAQGIDCTLLDESRAGFWTLARETRALARAWRPAVIHTHRRKEHLLGALAASACGAGLVATVHGRNEFQHARFDLRQRLLQSMENLLLSRVHQRLVAVSDELATELPGGETHTVIIPNSIDVSAVREAATRGPAPPLNDHRIQIGFLGRLVPVKQVDRMLKMLHRLDQAQPGRWALQIVGEGPLRDELRALTAGLRLERIVTFHGFLPNPLPLLSKMDLCLFASAHEGLPMTALESLALGVPIVSPPIGSLEWLIAEAGVGAVARSAQPSDLADALLALELRPAPRDVLRPSLLPERYRIENGVQHTLALWREAAREVKR